jgi:uncharacterized protein
MRAAGRPANLIMGPWAHTGTPGQVGDVNFGLAASGELVGFRGNLTDIQAGWFSQWLAPDAGQPRPELPPVLLFVTGINQWREEQEWPLPRAVDTELFLRTDGRLAHEPPEVGEASDT